MAEEKFDPLKEGPRSFAVLLAGMRDEGEESLNDEASAKLQGLVAKLRAASASKDAKVTGEFTLSLKITVLKGHADILADVNVKEPKGKGSSTHQILDSLKAHVARTKDADTVAWLDASATSAKLTVVYNYNCSADTHIDNIQAQARHGDHRALYAFPLSDAWKAWQGVSGKPMGQAELAAFLESRVTEIRGPADAGARVLEIARALVGGDDDTDADTLDGALLDERARRIIATPSQLLRLARRISMHVETRAVEERDAQGNVNIIFRSEATAESTTGEERGRVTLPQLLVIEVPVVQGGAPYKLPVRLSTRVQGQRCQWTLTVHRADLALEDAVTDVAEDFTGKTGVPVFRGSPE